MTNFHSATAAPPPDSTAEPGPPSTTYLVPINQAVLDQQSAITQRWNQAFHR